jgi:16S rRNA (uracil1498-N3)-methyltransferase
METMLVIKRVHKERQGGLLRRWEKIALNSSQQSQRTILPVIEEVTHFGAVLEKYAGHDVKLIPTLSGERITLREALSKVKGHATILLLIGPEGDFSPEEVSLAQRYGCLSLTLGKRVLRVETAAVAVVSFLQLFSV